MANFAAGTLLLLAIFVSLLAPLLQAAPWPRCLPDNGYYAAHSPYQHNIANLAKTLPANITASATMFSTATQGELPDIIHAEALCRGDINATACGSCVRAAFNSSTCSNSVHTTNDNIMVHMSHPTGMSSSPIFDGALFLLLNSTIRHAALASATLFTTSQMSFRGNDEFIYDLAQCTPDLRRFDCLRCLEQILDMRMQQQYSGIPAGTIEGIRCRSSYSVTPFFSGRPSLQVQLPALATAPDIVRPSPPPLMVPPAAGDDSGGNHRVRNALVISAAAVFSLVLLVVLAICIYRSREQHDRTDHQGADEEMGGFESLQVAFSTLKLATNNFSEQNRLGKGAFGPVYRGKLQDGQDIAVKRLSQTSQQGREEMRYEVALVAKLQHRNLVRLLGYCAEEQECLLVYEFLSNTSLDKFLYGSASQPKLTWEQRFRVIDGIARGLMYLQEDSRLKIIHRDLKPGNILLDADMNPKISDFGLARIFAMDLSAALTYHPAGTLGYMSPEYIMHGIFSAKSNVFSYGILVLEIITRRRPFSEKLLECVWSNWSKGNVMALLNDCCPDDEAGRQQLLRCIHVGLLCVQDDPHLRPRMATVVIMLNSQATLLPAPTEPILGNGKMRPMVAAPAPEPSINDVSMSEVKPR